MKHDHSLAKTLLSQGLLDQDQLRIALLDHRQQNRRLLHSLIQLGFVPADAAYAQLAALRGLGFADGALLSAAEPQALAYLPAEFVRQHRVLPLRYLARRSALLVAMAEPENVQTLDELRRVLPRSLALRCLLAEPSALTEAIDRGYGTRLDAQSWLAKLELAPELDSNSVVSDSRDDAHPIIQFTDEILADALRRRASDIHFEPTAQGLRIRYRIDGVLRQVTRLPLEAWMAILVRIKYLADLDIAESRRGQDGRFSREVLGQSVDCRVASMPVESGESVVIRLLLPQQRAQSLANLGFTAEALTELDQIALQRQGIVVISGPTGSGKTSTLYALLNRLPLDDLCAITLEDPVEYTLACVRQSSIRRDNAFGFHEALVASLRQDPDVLLLGEIRESAVAHLAFRAAMTGHCVLTTVHGGSTQATLSRLADMGVSRTQLQELLSAIINQRLVRKLCIHCKQSSPPPGSADPIDASAIESGPARRPSFFATGCPRCDNTGYRGRVPLTEIVRPSSAEAKWMFHGKQSMSSSDSLAAESLLNGRGFWQEGFRQLEAGQVDLAELVRVLGPLPKELA